MKKFSYFKPFFLFLAASMLMGCNKKETEVYYSSLKQEFINPPDASRPGVYWYFMDGNLSKEAMTKDLESMKKAGIGYVVYLEVNVGVPRGSVDFLSDRWMDMFGHAVAECERLGIDITLGVGPGWTGSGGPWVDAAQSMQHLVASSVDVSGTGRKTDKEWDAAYQRSVYIHYAQALYERFAIVGIRFAWNCNHFGRRINRLHIFLKLIKRL